MFEAYKLDLAGFGPQWVSLFRVTLEEEVGALLRSDPDWLLGRLRYAARCCTNQDRPQMLTLSGWLAELRSRS